MKQKPIVLATICARGGSKGVKNKNIRPLLGKPMIAYTLDCVKCSKYIDYFEVSTDSDEILKVVADLGFTTDYKRPPAFAADTSAKIDAIKHVVEYFEKKHDIKVDIVVDLDIGVPMRTSEDIDNAIEVLLQDQEMESLVTVYQAERNPYFNMIEKKQNGYYNLVKMPDPVVVRRQDAPVVYSVTPAIFAWKRSALHITHLYEGKWGICEMPIERSVDIDTEFEFHLVEFLMKNSKK
jgi:CMP-N-acetylneuraminic acid synthetase